MGTGLDVRIGFVGAGRMATALACGLVQELIDPGNVVACDIVPAAGEHFVQSTGAALVSDSREVVDRSQLIVLAVKPQQLPALMGELAPHLKETHLVVSIAAGVTLKQLEHGLGGACRLVRVMPNTPALLGCGAAGYSLGPTATADDGKLVEQILATVGVGLQVPESLLDAVTGLSGSGPAYVYQFIEALSDGGVRVGLPRAAATRLAAQTVLGAARMVLETGEHPGSLKDAVTSPGGTTIAGLHQLEVGGLRGIVMNAVLAATERSRELGHTT